MKRVKKPALILALAATFSHHSTVVHAAPGLVDVYQMALQHDAQLAQAQASYEANQQIMSQAKSLLLPQISASAGLNQIDSSNDANTGNLQEIAVSLQQPLFNREAFSRYDQAKYQLEEAHITFRLAQQNLMVRTSEAYFNVLLAEQSLRLATSKEAADKIQWEKAQASADVGLASRTDVLQARSSYDLSISDRISAENNLDVAYEQLMKLTGQPLTALKQLMLQVKLPSLALDKTALELKAEADNLTVRISQQRGQVAAEEIEAQKSAHWFNVNLQAQYVDRTYSGYSGTSAPTDRQDTTIGVQVSLPLYSGGRTSAQVAEARFNSQAANIAVRDAREQARLDARIQARNLERGYALVEALREAVKSSEAFLEAAEEGYRVGLRNMLDVLTARANLFQAQRNLAEALHNLVLTQLRLQSTLGELNIDHLRQLDMLLSNQN